MSLHTSGMDGVCMDWFAVSGNHCQWEREWRGYHVHTGALQAKWDHAGWDQAGCNQTPT